MAENSMSLENYANTLVSDIKDSIFYQIRDDAKKALISAINKTVDLEKKTYRPTHNLLDGVEIRDFKLGANRATFTVGINASKLIPDKTKPWNWNAHSSVGGQDFQEGLIDVLDKGVGSRDGTANKNPSKGQSLYNHPAHKFFEKAEDDMDRNLILVMAKALRAKGWKVSIY